jgi:hypothetical protein
MGLVVGDDPGKEEGNPRERASPFAENGGGMAVTLEHIFFLTQSVAALAIVGSLVFVAMEVRSSNQVNQHRIIEELAADYRTVRMTIASNTDVAQAWHAGLLDFSALGPVDKVRFSLIADAFFHTHESFYLHYHDGRLGKDLYEPQRLQMIDWLGYPGLQAVWGIRRSYFHGGFGSIVDYTIAVARSGGQVPDLYREKPASSA